MKPNGGVVVDCMRALNFEVLHFYIHEKYLYRHVSYLKRNLRKTSFHKEMERIECRDKQNIL